MSRGRASWEKLEVNVQVEAYDEVLCETIDRGCRHEKGRDFQRQFLY